MLERCPSCRARINGKSQCHRCKADLSLLLFVDNLVRQFYARAIDAYQLRDFNGMRSWLEKLQRLDATPPNKVFIDFLMNQANRFWVKAIGDQTDPDNKRLCDIVVRAATQIQSALGPGLTLRPYQDALSRELSLQNIRFKRNIDVPVEYRGLKLGNGAKVDYLVEDKVAVVTKSAKFQINQSQCELSNLMRLGRWPAGVMIYFESTDIA